VAIVVGSEILPNWPAEALKAQAVLTQTRLAHLNKSNPVLPDSTQSEAYLGMDYLRPGVEQAVRQTWGWILTYQNQPIEALYHSTCSGKTSGPNYHFRLDAKPLPYISSVACSHCKRSPFWKPHRTDVSSGELKRMGVSLPVTMLAKDEAGRPLRIKDAQGRIWAGYGFWLMLGQTLGWGRVPGTRYHLQALPTGGVSITSTGAGHGLGLCQWGAAALARQGWSWRRILQYYYPLAQVQPIAGQ
jgi:stage II sporulation protein D